MQRLIDAERIKEVFHKNVVGANAFDSMFDNAPTVLTIPDNPTNGDVQTAILKPYEIMKGKGYVLIYLTKEQREQHHWECWFDLEWWNSPYKEADRD